ncbi:MAG: 30S ribosomal protein S6 [Verrucomicrobia bacterium]|nr:30S ribosomal protein S6 [Verrucomicrobiota bacterium]
MNTYEGLFIFADTLKDEELVEALERVTGEITRQGGEVLGSKKLGRRSFARPMSKRDAGIYLRMVFSLDAGKITPLQARFKLSDDVFRVQITCGDEKSMSFVAPPVEETAEPKPEAAE